MDFLTRMEVSGFKQDLEAGQSKQSTDKYLFEKKLLGGLGDEMEDMVEHPEKFQHNIKFAKKANRKKRWTVWKENFRRIFGLKRKETV